MSNYSAIDMTTAAAQGFRDGVASVANSAIPNNQDASAAQSAPAGGDSHWFSLVMNCAAELETASYCMADTEAKRVAQSGANYYREKAGAARQRFSVRADVAGGG